VKNRHPTLKPLSLMQYLARLTKTPTGGVVIDPFAGSGTTLLASKLEGRKAIGIELSEAYCEIIAKRLEHSDYFESTANHPYQQSNFLPTS